MGYGLADAMELTQLRYFRAIAQTGSLTAAARLLRVSQPTLTVAVQKLEERYGTRLFMRHHHGVSLTLTGQELLGHAERVFTLLEQAEQVIHGLETEERGRFVIGCHESLGAYFLPSFLPVFMAEAPQIELSLWNGTSAGVLEAVLAGEVQFGLVVNPAPHPDLVLVDLCEDAVDLFVVVSKEATGQPFACETPEAARQLIMRGPVIFAGRIGQSHALLDRLAASEHAPSRRLACGDLELVKTLTLGGLGVGVLPRRVASYGQPGRLRRLHPDLPAIPDTICLIYRADLHRTRAALRLKSALVAHGRTLPPSASL